MSGDAQDWVIPPPAADSYQLTVLMGDGYELSPAAAQALETLAQELASDDVTGFMRETCFEGRCQPKNSAPCANFTTCKICLGYGS